MKRQYHHIILLSALFFCFSCRKDREVAKYKGDYTITGKVIDEITGKGVAQANVGVIERDRDATSHLGGKTVGFDKSDADGNFILDFSANSENNNYELTANALTYFAQSGGGDVITFTKNGEKAQNVSLVPYSYLAREIKGNKGGNKLSISWAGGGGVYYNGEDSVSVAYVHPNQNISFTYWVYFQDSSKNYSESIVLPSPPPHDTTYYLIEF